MKVDDCTKKAHQNCREYVIALSTSIPPSSLPPSTKVTIIGCGSHELISRYAQGSKCAYPLYVDPTQSLYKALNLARTMEPGQKPEYIKRSMLGGSIGSIIDGIKSGRRATKGGDFWQVGGEFLFVTKEGKWEVEWCHRMKFTRDHTEMEELKKVIGV
jgi:hypothetical protein